MLWAILEFPEHCPRPRFSLDYEVDEVGFGWDDDFFGFRREEFLDFGIGEGEGFELFGIR